jgi:hypothetical protein
VYTAAACPPRDEVEMRAELKPAKLAAEDEPDEARTASAS